MSLWEGSLYVRGISFGPKIGPLRLKLRLLSWQKKVEHEPLDPIHHSCSLTGNSISECIFQNLILHIRSRGTSFMTQSSWGFHLLRTEIRHLEMFCTTVVPAPKGRLARASPSIFLHDSQGQATRLDSPLCAQWLIYKCDKTQACVRRDSFVCVTWLINTCDMTHLYVWHGSFMCGITHSCVWHHPFICVTWRTHMRDTNHLLLYGVAMVSEIDKIISLFCRVSSLL